MEGQVCLLTDGVSAVGRQLAVCLAKMDATVVVVAKDATQGAAARAEIVGRSGSTRVEVQVCDLSSRDDVTELATDFLCDHDRLDVLINNAELMPVARVRTVDGWESCLAVNHLAPFLLTRLLLQQLPSSAPLRIVNVASGHHAQRLDLNDLNGVTAFHPARAYAATRLMNVLFTYELARRTEGTRITVNCVQPRPTLPLVKARAIGPLYLATSALLEDVSGKYFVQMKQARSADASYDPALAVRLWNLSAQFVEQDASPQSFPIPSPFVARSPAFS